MQKELWVCWVRPNRLPSENISILSFLRPHDEENVIQCLSEKGLLISGRKLAQEVKDDALQLYTELVAKIGSERIRGTHSLRQLLKSIRGNSLWWYHPVSFKDCEEDPTFNHITQVLAIDRFISEKGFENIVLWGADHVLVNVLGQKYRIECEKTRKRSTIIGYLRAVALRSKQLAIEVYHWYLIHNKEGDDTFTVDVVLQGFWDWSIRPSSQGEGLEDRYFKTLPNLLKQQNLRVGWLLWFDPHSEPRSEKRCATEVLNSACSYRNLIFLQKYLKISDIIKAFCDFGPAIQYLSIVGSPSFKGLYIKDGLNFFPIFRNQLSYHFISPALPHCYLVETACANAFAEFKPKMALTFLEMFPYSRALYAGAKLGSPETKLATMQHASYSREKTFLRLDPEREFRGKPDYCSVPKPDCVFAMGELGEEIFEECGFDPHDIFLTGSARYDHIQTEIVVKPQKVLQKKINLLMVTAVDRDGEMDMVEAVYAASEDLPCVDLFLRNHPFANMDEHPLFLHLKERIKITTGTLEDDLQNADLIMFSYSTVAEEAFLRGVPVWQWCSAGYNGSAFRDIAVIPRFYSVSQLRESLMKFVDTTAPFLPEDEPRNRVLNECFYRADGKASERILNRIIGLLN